MGARSRLSRLKPRLGWLSLKRRWIGVSGRIGEIALEATFAGFAAEAAARLAVAEATLDSDLGENHRYAASTGAKPLQRPLWSCGFSRGSRGSADCRGSDVGSGSRVTGGCVARLDATGATWDRGLAKDHRCAASAGARPLQRPLPSRVFSREKSERQETRIQVAEGDISIGSRASPAMASAGWRSD